MLEETIMSIDLPLSKMSLTEKLSAMEALWDDLCHAEQTTSPSWHELELKKREIKITASEHFSDWDTAKNRIRSTL